MSVIDEIRTRKEEIRKLEESAKDEALHAINNAIEALLELGFHYRLVNDDQEASARAPRQTCGSTGEGIRRGRRTGIREEVLRVVSENGDGVSRAKLLELMSAKGDKSAEQSISNALAALKKGGQLTTEGKLYKAA